MTDSPPSAAADDTKEEVPRSTVPEGMGLSAAGFADESQAQTVGYAVLGAIQVLGAYLLDLSSLDGVTVSYNYAQSLSELDRGFKKTIELTPTSVDAVSAGMTPSVLRDGKLKSHIVLNAPYVEDITDPKLEGYDLALHLIAHECAHVEVTHAFEKCFPGRLLRGTPSGHGPRIRWDVALGCWDEYAVTSRVAAIGKERTDDYEETFLTRLANTKSRADEAVARFRGHRQIAQTFFEVVDHYGALLKFASYHLGNMDGLELTPSDRPKTAEALRGHWFAPFFERLHLALLDIDKAYGVWVDDAVFMVVAQIHKELLAVSGVSFIEKTNGDLTAYLPDD